MGIGNAGLQRQMKKSHSEIGEKEIMPASLSICEGLHSPGDHLDYLPMEGLHT